MALIEVEPLGTYASRLWLNRPRALNALSPALMLELDEIFRRLEMDPKVRMVVFQGRGGKALAVGADLKAVAEISSGAEALTYAAQGQAIFQHFTQSRLITIAVIQGYALGGGLELALACDLRLATHSAKIGLPELGLGLIPGFGGTQRLPRLIGESRALWMLLSGETIDGDQAERYGLVNWVGAAAELESAIASTVEILSQKAPQAMAKVKALVRSQAETSTALKQEAAAFAELMKTDDAKKGLQAFFDRTIPKFDDD